jgi:AcrR family transcriptional regulator
VALMHKISLRQRKHAQTKVALAQAAMERLRKNRLDDISVKELCETIPISEVTFYNYFPRKTDLLIYYIQVISLEAAWYLQHAVKEKSSLEMVEECLDFMGRKLAAEPLMMTETIAYFGQERQPPEEFKLLSKVEQILAFPNLTGIEDLAMKDMGIDALIKPYLEQAIQDAELPQSLKLSSVVLMCASIFVGLVMNLHLTEPERIRPFCRRQLRLLWKALRVEKEEPVSPEGT